MKFLSGKSKGSIIIGRKFRKKEKMGIFYVKYFYSFIYWLSSKTKNEYITLSKTSCPQNLHNVICVSFRYQKLFSYYPENLRVLTATPNPASLLKPKQSWKKNEENLKIFLFAKFCCVIPLNNFDYSCEVRNKIFHLVAN